MVTALLAICKPTQQYSFLCGGQRALQFVDVQIGDLFVIEAADDISGLQADTGTLAALGNAGHYAATAVGLNLQSASIGGKW